MNQKDFVDYFRSRGIRVVKTTSSYWYEIRPFCFQSISYHAQVKPTHLVINHLFFRKIALLIRFIPPKSAEGKPGHIWICNNKQYDLDCLSANNRSKIRRGLNRTKCRSIDFQFLSREGYSLVSETAARQGRQSDFRDSEAWQQFCQAAGNTLDVEAWGSFVSERLAAFLTGALVEDYYYLFELASKTSFLKYYPNNE